MAASSWRRRIVADELVADVGPQPLLAATAAGWALGLADVQLSAALSDDFSATGAQSANWQTEP